MSEASPTHRTLGASAARKLANTTKTPPQWVGVTPRWLVSLLPWTPVEAGTYRVNRVKDRRRGRHRASSAAPATATICPSAFVDYEEQPREYTLSTVTTTIDVQTRISDLYRSPMDQVREQLGVLDRDGEGAAGERADQQRELRPAQQRRAGDARHDAHGRADARRPRRADREGVEGAGVLPRASARDRGVRPRVHAPRRAAADGDAVRLAVPHLARAAARPVRQARTSARRQDHEHPAAAHRREEARASSACSSPASPARSAPACRCASWASTSAAPRRTWSRSTARRRCSPTTRSACSRTSRSASTMSTSDAPGARHAGGADDSACSRRRASPAS